GSESVHYGHWTMTGGWAMAEHPLRRECTLYLFDQTCQPYLATWLGDHTLTLEPSWPHLPMRPEESIGFAAAISAGEAAGAGAEGAWVACRRTHRGGGGNFAATSRLRAAG